MVKKTDFDGEFIAGLTGLKKELQDLIARIPRLTHEQKSKTVHAAKSAIHRRLYGSAQGCAAAELRHR